MVDPDQTKKNSSSDKPALLLVPGLFSGPESKLAGNAAVYFSRQNFPVATADLYTESETYDLSLDRILHSLECSLKKCCSLAEEVIPIGHSFGALLLLLHLTKTGPPSTSPLFKRGVLWDPTFIPIPKEFIHYMFRIENNGVFMRTESDEKQINQQFFEELTCETGVKWSSLREINIHFKVIFAEHGSIGHYNTTYRSLLGAHAQFDTIPQANHTFDSAGAEHLLFENTLDFLRQRPIAIL